MHPPPAFHEPICPILGGAGGHGQGEASLRGRISARWRRTQQPLNPVLELRAAICPALAFAHCACRPDGAALVLGATEGPLSGDSERSPGSRDICRSAPV